MSKVAINPRRMPQRQVRPVVKAIGYGIQYWPEGIRNGSIDVVELMSYLLAANEDAPLDKYDHLSAEELLDMVELEVGGSVDPPASSST